MMNSRDTRPSLLLKVRRSDDDAAWADFVRLYGPAITVWCRQYGLQSADAEDVAQTILLRISQRIKTFDYQPAQGSFRAYLKTIARYAVTDFLAGRNERGTGDSNGVALLASAEATDSLAMRLEETFDFELLSEAMRRVRHRVDPVTWEAFELTALRHLPAGDAANSLNVPIAGIYQSKSRVLRAVRQELMSLDPDLAAGH